MNILVVGNILRDVYLNIDIRSAHLEPDNRGVKWMDIGFDGSEHQFFSSHTVLGGAAITTEVLDKMRLPATVYSSAVDQDEMSPHPSRYVLVADGKASYFAPSVHSSTDFEYSGQQVDYLYIDRSANLTSRACINIKKLLNDSPSTRFVLYVKDLSKPHVNSLISLANLVFLENCDDVAKLQAAVAPSEVNEDKIIHIYESGLQYRDYRVKIATKRIDVTTHLSIYSIATATVLGGLILGNSIEKCFAMAKANIENSSLDATLSMDQMQDLASTSSSKELELVATSLMLPGKGILAADESGGSIKKKFAALDIPDTAEMRRDYRNILLSAPNLEKYVNGVILFDETTTQHADNGQNFVDYLTARGIIPGIKVDQGLEKFANSEETYTKGLDGLDTRAREYYARGLRFAKWRAAFTMHSSDTGTISPPSHQAIDENCRILAEYAKICQDAGLVPIVEPELVYDGYYTIEQNAAATGHILDVLFAKLAEAKVNLAACILKVNMVMDGKQYKISTPAEVGKATAAVLKAHVPAELAGVVFLSGGQTVEQATDNLAAIVHEGPYPWPVSFSFARALQAPALEAWHGDNANVAKAKEDFVARLVANTDALKNSP